MNWEFWRGVVDLMEEISEGIQHLRQGNEDPFSTSTTTASQTGAGVQNKSKENQKQISVT